jgi:hypothetical protein
MSVCISFLCWFKTPWDKGNRGFVRQVRRTRLSNPALNNWFHPPPLSLSLSLSFLYDMVRHPCECFGCNPQALLTTPSYKPSLFPWYSPYIHRLLAESPLNLGFHVNSTTCFGYTGPSSGTYDDFPKLLHCVMLLYSSLGLYVRKVCYLNHFKICKVMYCFSTHFLFLCPDFYAKACTRIL